MTRLFSPFTSAGRFALILAANMILSGGASAQEHERDHERRGPTLVVPANGATVDRDFTVRIGFAGGGPHGPSEGTGISDGPPPDAPPPRREMDDRTGPSEGTGLGEHRPRGPHFVLLIDQPALDSGAAFHADAQHVAFPAGLPQMTLSLPSGQHKLVLQTLDRDGNIIQRHPPETITVMVK